jgi:hypothetical protein
MAPASVEPPVMDPGGLPKRRPGPVDASRIAEIVPRRAVLTELARGFLMVQSDDPERAKQFASSFLREQAGRPGSERSVPPSRRPMVRRRPTLAADDRYSVSSGYADDPSEPEL